MVWYDSHGLIQTLPVVHSGRSIEEDTTFYFSLCTRESEVDR